MVDAALKDRDPGKGRFVDRVQDLFPGVIDIDADDIVRVDSKVELLAPILLNTLQQLFAYYMAVERGNDVDQPRNLAKSVTVE